MRLISFISTILFTLMITMIPEVSNAETETPLKMEELTVQVLPEYSYHPEEEKKENAPLLVGYHGTLKNETDEPLKGKIEIPLPAQEENFKVGFVGDYSNDLTELYDVQYELDVENGVISWETSEEIEPEGLYKFVIEYYTTSIGENGEKKTLDFQFKSFTEIGLMNLVVIEPLNTEKFTLEPASYSHQKNSYNMNMFVYMTQGMKPGDEKKIDLEYVRNEERTSSEIMAEMAGSDGQQEAATKNTEKLPPLAVLLTVGGVTIVSILLLILFLKRRGKKKAENNENEQSEIELKKAKLRSMLLEGNITEEEYKTLLAKIGGN